MLSTTDTADTTIRLVCRFLETQEALRAKFGMGASDLGDTCVTGLRMEKEGRSATYLVSPEVFRREVCAGSDPKVVLRTLKAHGYLEHDHGRFDKSVRIAGAGKKRVYAIKTGILQSRRESLGSGDCGDCGDKWSKLAPIRGVMGDGPVATQLRGTCQE